MNWIKAWMLNKLNVLLASFLTLLGFSSCDSSSPWSDVCEYGTPHSNYEIQGAVLDLNDKALKDIRIITKKIYSEQEREYCVWQDTLYTDSRGAFKSNGILEYSCGFRVIAEDTSGEYASDSVMVEWKHSDKGRDSWCDGTEIGKVNFQLKKIEKDGQQ